MTIRNILLAVATVASLVAIETTPAAAGGFLADTFVRPFSPQAATALDRGHAAMGPPWTMRRTLLLVLARTSSSPAAAPT